MADDTQAARQPCIIFVDPVSGQEVEPTAIVPDWIAELFGLDIEEPELEP